MTARREKALNAATAQAAAPAIIAVWNAASSAGPCAARTVPSGAVATRPPPIMGRLAGRLGSRLPLTHCSAPGVGREAAADRGQPNIDDRTIDEGEARCQDRGGQHEIGVSDWRFAPRHTRGSRVAIGMEDRAHDFGLGMGSQALHHSKGCALTPREHTRNGARGICMSVEERRRPTEPEHPPAEYLRCAAGQYSERWGRRRVRREGRDGGTLIDTAEGRAEHPSRERPSPPWIMKE